MQTNAKAEQAGFKASGRSYFPLKTLVQKDTLREPKKNAFENTGVKETPFSFENTGAKGHSQGTKEECL